MPRPMWSGAISFGLVNVPVKLYSAVAKKDIRFHQLHDADGVRIQQKRVCPADGMELSIDNIVKGYEIARDSYVVVTFEELETLDPKASRTIEIEDFVDIGQIDPVYFEHAYYLVPDKGSVKAYSLLLTAMKKAEKVAIATVVMRSKQYLVAIRPMDKALGMTTMLYADEIISEKDLEGLPSEETELSERELELAEQIVNSQSADFDLGKYKDDYRERVINLIERKAEGQEIVAQPAAEEGGKVVDLMSALEASLAAAKEKTGARRRAGKKQSA